MHEYGITDHDRAGIGRWLGTGAIFIAGGITQLLAFSHEVTSWAAFGKASIATGAIYFALHFLFNRCIWKNGLFKIPNLNGLWTVEGQTLDEEGNVKFEWQAKLHVEQTWSKIAIHLETSQSSSNSYSAILHRRYGKKDAWSLSYSYRNEPIVKDAHELNAHRGYCEIDFESDFQSAMASYFNNGTRRTFGTMRLIRKTND